MNAGLAFLIVFLLIEIPLVNAAARRWGEVRHYLPRDGR